MITEEQKIFEAYEAKLFENRDFQKAETVVDTLIKGHYIEHTLEELEEMVFTSIGATEKLIEELIFRPNDVKYDFRERSDIIEQYLLKLLRDTLYERSPRNVVYRVQRILFSYSVDVKKARWKELEDEIESIDNPNLLNFSTGIIYYTIKILRGRWREIEPAMIQVLDETEAKAKRSEIQVGRYNHLIEQAVRYARDVIGGRWPEAERHLKNENEYKKLFHRDITDRDAYFDHIDDILDDD